MNDDKTTAIVPLLIEETSKDGVKIREFTFSGGPTPKYIIDSKIGRKLYNRIEGEIWHKINSIAKDQGVVKLWMRENVQNRCYLLSSTLKDVCDLNATDLAKSGFLDTSIYSSVLFLDQCENFLMSQMRKGHHAAIKKALKFLSVNYYDSDSISPEKMEQFRERYFYIAGKVTRPYKTFDILYDFIKSNNGVLFEACLGNKAVGYSYVIIYKGYAYYAMSCTESEYKEFNVSHYLQWKIIIKLKQIGVIFYELGEQHFEPTFFYSVSEKIKGISAFKRGFGGRMILQISGEYFYDKEFFKKTFDERILRYIEERWK